MRQLPALLCLLALASACSPDQRGPGTPAGPSTTFTSPTLSPAVPQLSLQTARAISVGEEVNDTLTFHGDNKVYELTAPSDGTLVARLSWDLQQGSLELALADVRFYPTPPDGSLIVGKLHVAVGQKYRLTVADSAPWDYDILNLPFRLTTSIESQGTSGLYEIIASHSQKCLDLNGWSAADGTPLIQWTCHGGDNQIWSLETAADGYSRIISRHSGKCLDVNGASTDDGAPIIQWQCHGGANQTWLLRSVTTGLSRQ